MNVNRINNISIFGLSIDCCRPDVVCVEMRRYAMMFVHTRVEEKDIRKRMTMNFLEVLSQKYFR